MNLPSHYLSSTIGETENQVGLNGSTPTNDPIFIFGSARSGTSLLSRIVGAHPRIAIPFESHLYNTFYPWLKFYGDLSLAKNRERLVDDILSTEVMQDWMPRPERQQILEAIECFDFHGVVAALMNTWTHAQGKQRWGEKTPWHVFYWSEILEAFPNAKIIHIVRDGRDAALSWQQARFGPKHMYLLARRWVHYLDVIEQVRTAVDSTAFFELRYEDLLANPETVARQICHFLGEEFSPEMLAFYTNDAPYPTDKQNQTNLTKPILATNTEKWRTEMTQRELRIFEAVAGDVLTRYRYPRQLDRAEVFQFESLWICYIEHPLRKLFAMLKNRKGHIDGLRRLKIYLRLRLGL
ncbi:sulfotransferase [Pleurocapsales cyanobacterium LEGE 06147]|nr:sulfotransferase [Pleurocapsales cyanobacterium LEGE 06147]